MCWYILAINYENEIPEEARSTIMNFCIPLNIFMCVVLYNVNAFPITIRVNFFAPLQFSRITRLDCHGDEQ
ncbi:hypothetical protein GUJ93_ZPchr0004g39007 [Zizania palustris]|uniref:Uncharacterized protein n=1 Tax=Zizania palustris TaxID=103762 RepID=A0A8J5SS77_ZIZPA|nr:hypothetical protein GUJ93_ZPchr0004g39007 [Zizania palustris]